MKILVVEDEPRIAEYLRKGLQLHSYVVDVAHDGSTGYDLASSEDYQVIVLDYLLPGMSGLEICQRLRSEHSSTPILMLTAKTQIQERVAGLEAGADDYLGKPFAFSELLARIRALARRPRTQAENVLRYADLELNLQTMQVLRAGKSIKLSRTEFVLLEYLLRHVGQVVSKEQLIEQVWRYDSEVLPNTAQVYVGYLRQKIDAPFPRLAPILTTVRGFGYRLGG